MKKTFKIFAVAAITFTSLMTSFDQGQKPMMKNSSNKNKVVKYFPNLSKVHAAGPSSQELYSAIKSTINTDLGGLIDDINELLGSASITACSSVPSESKELKVDGSYSIHSEPVGSVSFPISELGITLDKKLVYKLNSTAIGVLYLDCDKEAALVKYLGKNNSDDWNVAVAYADVDSGEHILMAEDYNAGTDYEAAKVAVYYLETSSAQKLRYIYNPTTAANALTGYFEASPNGTVTGNSVTDVSDSINENTALTNLSGTGFVSPATSFNVSISL